MSIYSNQDIHLCRLSNCLHFMCALYTYCSYDLRHNFTFQVNFLPFHTLNYCDYELASEHCLNVADLHCSSCA